MEEIGKKLKEERKKNKLTLKEVSDYLECTPTAISLYENGSRKPNMRIIEKLAYLYKTTPNAILGVQDEETDIKLLLSHRNLHWDGIPLYEEELEFIWDFLEKFKKEKANEEPKQDKKSVNE